MFHVCIHQSGARLWSCLIHVLLICVLALTGCFKSERPPGFSTIQPDNGAPTKAEKDVSAPTPDVATPNDTADAADAEITTLTDITADADVVGRTVVLDAGADATPEPELDALPPADEVSSADGDTSFMPDSMDVTEEISEADASGDCPTCEGSPFPSWSLLDFQPASEKFGESYGLEAFKGRVIVLALLAGW